MTSDPIDPRTPVLVGIGLVMQREDDPGLALEPVGLMIQAARKAGADTGAPDVLAQVDRICVPQGRWKYGDPGRLIAHAIGAARATTVLSRVGVLQQTLIGDACRRVAEGENTAVLVIGGEAGYRIQCAARLGMPAAETPDDGAPDETLAPHAPLRAPAELAVGLTMPVGLYAMVESAFRAAKGVGLAEHRDRMAELYSRFSSIAQDNAHAWTRTSFAPSEIRDAGPGNPMQAFPYTRRHCSSWSVDQASALLIMSASAAAKAGIPQSQWIFALASSESNHMQTVSSRRELHRSAGARIAGEAVLAASGRSIEEIAFLDLYSCFPSAIEICAEELKVPLDRNLTVTGGMAFAGGPYNNYVLHSTAQMGLMLRQNAGTAGLVGCISGVITKQAFAVWSQGPGTGRFAFEDVTERVALDASPLQVVDSHSGMANVVGYTVLHQKGSAPRGIVIADVGQNRRAVACTDDAGLVAGMQERELCGAPVLIEGNLIRSMPPA